MAELPKDMIFHYHSDDGMTVKVTAIPLVRCKDCEYCEYPNAEREWCKKGHLHGNAETWFCADGERKEQDDAVN